MSKQGKRVSVLMQKFEQTEGTTNVTLQRSASVNNRASAPSNMTPLQITMPNNIQAKKSNNQQRHPSIANQQPISTSTNNNAAPNKHHSLKKIPPPIPQHLLQDTTTTTTTSTKMVQPTPHPSVQLYNVFVDAGTEQKELLKRNLWFKIDQELQCYLKARKNNTLGMHKQTTLRKEQVTQCAILMLHEITADAPTVTKYKTLLVNCMILNAQIEQQKKYLKKHGKHFMDQVDVSRGSQFEDMMQESDDEEQDKKKQLLLPASAFEEKALCKSLKQPRTDADVPAKHKGKLGKALKRAFDILVEAEQME